MNQKSLYGLLRDITKSLSAADSSMPILPEEPDFNLHLSIFGLDITSLPEILQELQNRFNGKDLGMHDIFTPESLNTMTLSHFMDRLINSFQSRIDDPIVVYVDDEEENLFVFQRKYGRRLNLKTFVDPSDALEFIRSCSDVALVITDEVMPNMTGNILCDEVKKFKPHMKFILITGNPNQDDDLMYRTLKHSRFYEFINKPLNLEEKGEDYYNMIQGIIHFTW